MGRTWLGAERVNLIVHNGRAQAVYDCGGQDIGALEQSADRSGGIGRIICGEVVKRWANSGERHMAHSAARTWDMDTHVVGCTTVQLGALELRILVPFRQTEGQNGANGGCAGGCNPESRAQLATG